MTTLRSSRFGELEVPQESIIDFPAGLIGLGGRQYALLAKSDDSAFVWLHSLEDPDLALPVTNPWQFFASYEVELADEEAARVGLTDADAAEASVYVTVRCGERPEDTCVNLRAPIVISGGFGYQVINMAQDAPVRAKVFAQQEAAQPEAA
ncbi:flagellar assembly protein FliW [Conexibacter sp. SYSU D00693]|uniref:flagellar assembly protein FliW n=1 Tax=Conexibacter sp. SYSU D00693 TaxID=2812560 RepID=UPI00196AB8F6|nr:flagellar assembly protein FliW [Conexibacter sp. SYSU D00693]